MRTEKWKGHRKPFSEGAQRGESQREGQGQKTKPAECAVQALASYPRAERTKRIRSGDEIIRVPQLDYLFSPSSVRVLDCVHISQGDFKLYSFPFGGKFFKSPY